MRIKKIYCLLLLCFLGLLFSLSVACTPTGYKTYDNEEFGYSVSYPMNWKAEVSADGTIYLLESPTRRGSVMIDVRDAMSLRSAVIYWLMSVSQGTINKEVAKLEDKPMKGAWDWYLSYDYETDFGIFHGEAYFKLTDTHLYRLDTLARVGEYKDYPFSTIISLFKLR